MPTRTCFPRLRAALIQCRALLRLAPPALAVVFLGLAGPAAGALAAEPKVSFNHDIRPLFSDTCFKCHGFDAKTREAELRLDTAEGAFARRDGGAAVVPGNPAHSQVMKRLLSTDPDERMPPPASGLKLSPEQIALVRQWIEQGAEYQGHWAFLKPERPPLPEVPPGFAPALVEGNPIDRFVAARLHKHGLNFSPPAHRALLLRRLTLDLTGLPPTPDEVRSFEASTNPLAYEHEVDRLLRSPRYGERMAVEWLDAARFADTHGYHIDSGRDMTVWREWVIEAYNRNLPFDQFTMEQLAGDLLPGATLEQKIATGFNRNNMVNFEGGAIPEEYYNQYLVDRVNTTSAVWLGLTMGCAQCHDHKYDPITQREFYRFYAFFHQVPENGLDGSKGNAVPFIKTPRAAQQRRLEEIAMTLRAAETSLLGANAAADAAQVEWEKQAAAGSTTPEWQNVLPSASTVEGGGKLEALPDGSLFVSGANPAQDVYRLQFAGSAAGITAVKIEALPDERLKGKGPGRSVNGNIVLTAVKLAADGQPIALSQARADFSQETFPVQHLVQGNAQGWAIHPRVGEPLNLVLAPAAALPAQAREWSLALEFKSPHERHQLGRFRVAVTRSPRPLEATDAALAPALAVPRASRTPAQQQVVRSYFRTHIYEGTRNLASQQGRLTAERAAIEREIPTTMVMEDSRPRKTFVLLRGAYDKPGEEVRPGVPESLPPLPEGAPPNRLGLAQWLVSAENPLTARVAVNRLWQQHFGRGLVETSEDFGSQASPPSHPDLLDYLAVDFRESGWNVKRLQRLIVTSATYRQSSAFIAPLAAQDPGNRWLGRFPRQRLKAEFLRDQALAISGLLDPRIGGPSVSPYQPAGIWEELAYRADFKNWTAQVYEQSQGPDLYRRSMYTFWKRTAPPPQLVTFDAPDRESCTVRRSTTNTPLQALVLMNDPTYVEAARKLAERLLAQAGPSDEQRLDFAFQLATARSPKPQEQAVLLRMLAGEREHFRAQAAEAEKLLAVGESPANAQGNPGELAAWTLVATTLLNLDETITRP